MSDAADSRRDAPSCHVYHGPGTSPVAFGKLHVDAISEDEPEATGQARPPRAARRVRLRWRQADELFARRRGRREASVLLMDASLLERIGELRDLPQHVVIVATDEASESALGGRAHLSVVELRDAAHRVRALRTAAQLSAARLMAARLGCALAQARHEVHELNRIGMALMDERDLSVLLPQIVHQGKQLTGSDAGVLMLMERDEHDTPRIRMTLYQIDSVTDLPDLSAVAYQVDSTTAIGHAVVVGEPVVIADAYELPPEAPYRVDKWFDRQFGYHTRSMLVAPMVDRRDRVVGVLLLVNRKSEPGARITSKEAADRYVLPYRGRVVRLARALASQAAVAIENARLHKQVEHLLESFVKAAASAIDERDPSTAGHSVRVATLVTDLAAAVERESGGPYRDVRFTRAEMRELRFAALLHDLGKLGVREDLLTKAKKLPPYLWERVEARFTLIRRTMEVEYRTNRARLGSGANARELSRRLDADFTQAIGQLERVWNVVRAANEPSADPEPPPAELAEIANHTFEGSDRGVMPYLTAEELRYLQIPCGTLDDLERVEIEAHVDQTFRFLAQIPWSDDLKNLPRYAGMHHEKIDGSGYPRRIRGEDIPVQARLLTIADIFDALTESDRPYRRSIAPEKAIDILQTEAKAGLLDSELVRIMVESQVYRKILEEDWHRL